MIQLLPVFFIFFIISTSSTGRCGEKAKEELLDLMSCVRIALEKDPNIAIQWEEARSNEGQVQIEAGVFDYALFFSAEGGEDRIPLSPTNDRLVGNLSFSGNAVKLFQSGLEVAGDVSLIRQDLHIADQAPTSSGKFSLDFTLPLLEGRGRKITTAALRIADWNHNASLMDYHHTLSTRVLATTQAYWEYLAAVKSLEIARESEGRSKTLMEETRQLIEADEAPKNEMIQLQADLAAKRAARVTAESQVFQTRWRLGLAIGVSPEEIRSLPNPSTAFPEFKELKSPPMGIDNDFIREALTKRADYLATQYRKKISSENLDISRDRLKPNLDLQMGASYNSLESGGDLEAFYNAIYKNIPGPSYYISLKYRFPIKNNTARGQFVQSEAANLQSQLRSDDLGRQISVNVVLALENLNSSYLGLEAAYESVQYSQLAVENERKKYRLGFSTLIDLINLQDRLTLANTTYLSNQSQFMNALAQLRFEIGYLIDGEVGKGKASASLKQLTAMPEIDPK